MIRSEAKPFPKAEILSTLLFLFFIKEITLLVESIYMLNLLNTQMDIRAAGISLLFLPGLLFTLKHNKATYIGLVFAMLVCVLSSPLLPTPWRIFSAGIGAGLFLVYLGLQLSDKGFQEVNWGRSAANATFISIAFRAIGDSLDFSLTEGGIFFEWLLIAAAATLFYFLINEYPSRKGEEEHNVEKSSN